MSRPTSPPRAPRTPPPAWATDYRAGDFPPYGYAADVLSFAMDHERGTLSCLVVERGLEPFLGDDAWPGTFVNWADDDDAATAVLRGRGEKTGIQSTEYLETLDTYDANGRDPRQWAGYRNEAGEWVSRGARIVSKAFVALHRDWRKDYARFGLRVRSARWTDVYQYLPWEDRRTDGSRLLLRQIVSALLAHDLASDDAWTERVNAAFGAGGYDWNEERVSDRYRLMLEARLVEEAWRDDWGQLDPAAPARERALFGRSLAFDHRRMLADGLGRLRGRIKYQPALLEALMPPEFSLARLRLACEALGGRLLVRPNFIRVVTRAESYRIVEPRLGYESGARPGPPAKLYGFLADTANKRLDPSIRMPWERLPRIRAMRSASE